MTTQAPNIPYQATPATVVNQAIDMLGEPGQIIGDLTDGTPVAEAARRYYGQGLRQLLRTAHWDFARTQERLQLLGDATGTAATDTPPVSAYVESPWAYCYAWPQNAVQGRWLPWTPINAQPDNEQGVPLTTGASALAQYNLIPGRFLVSSSSQYPVLVGQPASWEQMPDIQRTEGLGMTSRKVILTDCCEARFVYTRLVTTIEEWDALFREAFVMMLAASLAPTVIKDKKLALAERDRLIPLIKMAVADARVANGNESGMPQSVDHQPAWITGRNWGAGFGAWGNGGFGAFSGGPGGLGYYGCGFDMMSFGGSVF